VYPAKGTDRWIAVTFATSGHWQNFENAESLEAKDAVARDAALTRWCAGQSGFEAAERLQQLGIAAGAVQDMSDLMERDAQLAARHPLLPLVHPLLGEFGHMRTPIDFSRCTTSPFRAPGMGEHNRQIATEICGLTASRCEELETLGVFR
jgi:crotonobetainyl-CoA:carnitine CoA-transferase CaiB-like acyl-CoA transferase